uniref:Uncharacterized protein n=1 Tax=Haptolina ericina TaxID=156174 RepID=A0A7S3AZI2_9EUKA|eukprot:CAMPEP_0181233286 /NCGR_PEP_ID=MMETSP1096-20121128/36246_1 /TAXON_ID=156174 ORGANISM="Chrysochromulina ericina, Strain CCMP281" /NCGR_SAMPLE_ID=MMETSP1096 /ASSEMBLY_ACC=CAM_ASM_000453 /LENGTH=135 /DNA_ID=CAMNT_0023327759 /DNA_START=133 /DNA_END=540 /DNA_ORIENTATION=-
MLGLGPARRTAVSSLRGVLRRGESLHEIEIAPPQSPHSATPKRERRHTPSGTPSGNVRSGGAGRARTAPTRRGEAADVCLLPHGVHSGFSDSRPASPPRKISQRAVARTHSPSESSLPSSPGRGGGALPVQLGVV